MAITQHSSASRSTTSNLRGEAAFAVLGDEAAQPIATAFDASRLLSGRDDAMFGTPSGLTGNPSSPPSTDHSRQTSKLFTRSTGIIAWYCFIASLVVPIIIGLLYKWTVKCRSQRRAQQALDRELRLESATTPRFIGNVPR